MVNLKPLIEKKVFLIESFSYKSYKYFYFSFSVF